MLAKGELIEAASLDESVCDDPDDDKFFASVIAGEAMLIVSGDKHLLRPLLFTHTRIATRNPQPASQPITRNSQPVTRIQKFLDRQGGILYAYF